MVFLGIEYLGVLVKLSLYDHHSLAWKIIFGLITPALLVLAFVVSNHLNDKTFNVVIFFLLAGVNLIYLLTPVSNYLRPLIYDGNNSIVIMFLVGLISIVSSVLILLAFTSATYFILKK